MEYELGHDTAMFTLGVACALWRERDGKISTPLMQMGGSVDGVDVGGAGTGNRGDVNGAAEGCVVDANDAGAVGVGP